MRADARCSQFFGLAAAALSLLCLVACGGSNEPVTALPAEVQISAPASVDVNEPLRLTLSAPVEGADLTWSWSLGDGRRSNAESPEIRYSQPGRYSINLELSNGNGQRVQATGSVTVGYFSRLQGRECTAAATQGWCWQSPAVATRAVKAIDFADARLGVAVGELGHVAVTQDGGASWQTQPPAVAHEALVAVKRIDSTRLWAVTEDSRRLLRSQDTGRSWKQAGMVPLDRVEKLWVTDKDIVVVTGRVQGFNSASVFSADAGATWTRLSHVVSELSKTGVMWSGIDRSLDNGKSFVPLVDGVYSIAHSVSNDAKITIMKHAGTQVGVSPVFTYNVHQSADGGRSWVEHVVQWPEGTVLQGYPQVTLGPDGRGLALINQTPQPTGDGSVIVPAPQATWRLLATDNGGRNWRDVTNGLLGNDNAPTFTEAPFADPTALWYTENDFRYNDRVIQRAAVIRDPFEPLTLSLSLPGEPETPRAVQRVSTSVWLVGYGPYLPERWYSSADAGRSWTRVPSHAGQETRDTVAGLWFFDAKQGLRVDRSGAVMTSVDAGRSWQSVAIVGNGSVGAWRLQVTLDGIALVTAAGKVYRSDDRGRHWQAVPMPASWWVTQVQFVDAMHGWAAASTSCSTSGDIGFCENSLFRTEDGGRSWQATPAPLSEYQNMAFANANVGVWTNWDGTIQRTTDGGRSFKPAQTDVVLTNRGALVQFDALQRGWIVPEYGPPRILRSTDAGATWRTISLPLSGQLGFDVRLSQLSFGDSQFGWIVGNKGLILVTDDGGLTWKVQSSGTQRDLETVNALDPYTAWVGGAEGLVLSTATAGH